MNTIAACTVGLSENVLLSKPRHIPFINSVKLRAIIGFILLISSAVLAGLALGNDHIDVIMVITATAWFIAVRLTDKYVHKYPQRYRMYLIASHLKAAIIMAGILWIMLRMLGSVKVPPDALCLCFIIFTISDAIISLPRRTIKPAQQILPSDTFRHAVDGSDSRALQSGCAPALSPIDTKAVVRNIRSSLDKSFAEFIERNLPFCQEGNGDVIISDDTSVTDNQAERAPVGLLVGRTRVNDVRRLNRYLQCCAERITMGGYIAVKYMPFENIVMRWRRNHSRFTFWLIFVLHFIWYRAFPKLPWLDTLYFSSKISWVDHIYLSIVKRRNRVLSKAEAWGRLAFCGLQVIAESEGDGERYLLAQRVSYPVQNRRPSYYPIVALEKVGLDGELIRMHKIRTMYPFSEFLQKRIFDDHGLASTGKFANDFRLTDYGKFIRKFWLDELPQVFDWLRGEVKLVGMRATSRHFLSLYPKEVYNLYIQIKPGLVPPIFDESTNGFEHIVKVELTYLQRYWNQPIRTDISYLIQTFTDIVFRGVRSK